MRGWRRPTTRPRAAATTPRSFIFTTCVRRSASPPPPPTPPYRRASTSNTNPTPAPQANDYWTSIDDSYCHPAGDKKLNLSIVDLWATDSPAYGQNNSWACTQSNQAAGCKYEDELFVEEVLARIAAHDPATPFFLFWAPHIAHAPLEVPQAYVDKFAFIPDRQRQLYAAMVTYVDGMIGRVVDALKAKNMWSNLLWISSADNGGPIYNSGAAGANNWPMRGGKMSNWQGGAARKQARSAPRRRPANRGPRQPPAPQQASA